MALSAKPTSYSVNTGHAKCPDHLYMLDDSTGATNCNDGAGSLDLTADSAAMWNTDATYGQILRFVSASSQKALSAASFAATTGLCAVFIVRSASATNPGANRVIGGVGHNSTGNTFAYARYGTNGTLSSIGRYNGGTTWTATSPADVYDAGWHMIAIKLKQSGGSDGELRHSVDGSDWGYGSEVTTHDITTLGFNRIGLGCAAAPTPTSFFDGDILAAFVYVDDWAAWDDAWIASLWADPWQFLSTGGASATVTPNPAGVSV